MIGYLTETTTCVIAKPLVIIILFRTKTVEAARADGERIKLIGAAEAKAVEAVGR